MILGSALVEKATELIDEIGLLGVASLIAAESIFPPIPSEAVLLLTGFQVSEGRFGFAMAVLFATVGSLVGALALYFVGRLVGEERFEWLLEKFGKPLGFKKSDIERADRWWERYGDRVVLFGRMVPLVRSIVSIPAGAEGMPLARFCVYTSLGSAVWNTVWIGIGRALGPQWEKAERWTGMLDYILIALLLGACAWLIIRRRRSIA
jgi:membrane protein DedA with SNARE-associated domain